MSLDGIWEVQRWRPWMLQDPWYTDLCYKAQDYAEVAYFEQRRGINDSKGLGPIRAIILE